MAFDGSGQGEGITEVNVIPLIDVSLVLVVILILLTPLAFESNIAVQRALAAARAAQQQDELERIELAIVDEASVRVNRTRVAREDLAATLTPMLAGLVPPPLVVTCDEAVSHGTFVNVLDVAKTCGAKEIAVTLSLTTRAVEGIKYRVMQQLQVKSTAELVRFSIENRLVS